MSLTFTTASKTWPTAQIRWDLTLVPVNMVTMETERQVASLCQPVGLMFDKYAPNHKTSVFGCCSS